MIPVDRALFQVESVRRIWLDIPAAQEREVVKRVAETLRGSGARLVRAGRSRASTKDELRLALAVELQGGAVSELRLRVLVGQLTQALLRLRAYIATDSIFGDSHALLVEMMSP